MSSPNTVQPYHFFANPIWCDSSFNNNVQNSKAKRKILKAIRGSSSNLLHPIILLLAKKNQFGVTFS